MHIVLGDELYCFLTKSSWKTKEKIWPLIARMLHANKQSISNLYMDINEKIHKDFMTETIVQNINEMSRDSAANLWRSLKFNEMKITRDIYNPIDKQSYKNLMEMLSQLLEKGTWTQQKITMSLLCRLLQRNVPIPLSCVKTFLNFLRHGNIEIRKVCLTIYDMYNYLLF